MGSPDIFEEIAARYSSLTRSERRIADYVLEYRDAMKPVTIQEMADACGVSKATVTRFCRSVNLDNFSDLKWSISASLLGSTGGVGADAETDVYDGIMPEDSILLKCQKLHHISTQALTQTLSHIDTEAIDAAVDLLCRARNVYCFGQGNSSIVASDAWGRFSAVTAKFHWISDSHMQAYAASLLGPGDVVLYFSFSGATRELMELGRIIESTGSRLILITRFSNSPGAELADVVLVCAVNENPRSAGSIAAKIGQLFIIDILFNEFCARDQQAMALNREKTRSATAQLHI